MDPMDPNSNETRQFNRQPAQPDRPRQYFPQPGDQQWDQPSSYADPAYGDPAYADAPQPQNQGRQSNTAVAVLGIIAAIAAIVAIVFLFLWRGAAAEANREPDTVTVTSTQEHTVTETTTRRPSWLPDFGRGDTPSEPEQVPTLPSDLPTELPDDVPPEVQDQFGEFLDDLVGQADQLLNNLQ